MTQPTSDAILARMLALHPKIIDLTLDRVWRLLNAWITRRTSCHR